MTTTTLRPGRRRSGLFDTRKISKPRLSQLILVSTGAVIALVLFIWLLYWINPTRRGIGGRWLAQRGLTRPWISHQAADIEKITGAVKGTVNESNYDSFPDILREHLNKAANRPVVLYISAAGVMDDQGAVLLRDDAGVIGEASDSGTRQSVISLEKFFEVFRDAAERFPSQSRFLIWDAGQIGSDRNLGIYANGFLPKLRSYLAENPVKRLVILGSCAPGQTSAASEFDDRTVFGYFVEQALSGKEISANGLTVQSLSRYVRAQVTLWVRNNRQAEQTPELYGDVTHDFPLPRSRKVSRTVKEDPAEVAESKRVLKRLERSWADRDDWQKRKPYRSAPRTWLRFQETLLRAERLYRAGELIDAEQSLNSLPNLASEVGRVPALEGSIALLEKRVANTPDEAKLAELQTARTNINEALDGILGGEEPAAPGEETGDETKPADPATPKDETKKPGDPGTPPAAKKVEIPKKTVVAAAKKKPGSGHGRLSFTSRRVADSPIARLFDIDDDRRPLYPEAQLIVWADTFTTQGPDRNAFRGKRGEALEKAMQTRTLAEVAAASDERINRWIRPWVEAGDVLRRKGQDLLFASESEVPRCLEELDQADEAYQVASKHAETCEQAIDLVEQLSAELPYYGEWKARRVGRLEVGLDQPFQDLLDATAELARLIHSNPPPLRTEGDPLAGRDEQILRIKRQESVVSETFHSLTDDFQNQWEGGRWRDLDSVLGVPLIPAAARMKILERAGSFAVAASLRGTPASEGTSTSTDAEQSRLRRESDAFLTDRSSRSSTVDPFANEEESPSDPNFWRTASGLARLELGLLEIGGSRKEEIASLREVYDRACRKLGGSPFAEFAEFSERIRSLRRARLLAINEKPSPDALVESLLAGDRAIRVLPLADSVGRDKIVEARIKFLRRDLANWHGERLLGDFAPRQSLVVLEKAGGDYGDSDDLRKTVEKSKVMARARMLVEATAPEKPNLDDLEGMNVSMKVSSEGEIPQGDAVAFLSHDLKLPVSVSQKDDSDDTASATGIVVPIGTGNPAEPVEFVVKRTDSTPETVTIKLEPGAFYRGQIFPKDLNASSIVFRLTPGKEGIDVTLRQSDRKLIKIYGDQFERHPGKGFLHPHTPLAYRFVISHTLAKTAKVWIRYGLEGKDDTFVIKKDVKLEPGRPNEEIVDRVDTDLHEVPTDSARWLSLEIRKDSETGRVLFKRRYPFRQVLPSQYMRVQDGFDEVQNMAYVNVWHLKSDPVSGPSEITVALDGQSISTILDRGGAEQWWRIYPQPPLPVFWKIQVEKVIDAFKGRIDTGVVPPEKTAPPQ